MNIFRKLQTLILKALQNTLKITMIPSLQKAEVEWDCWEQIKFNDSLKW